MMNINERVELVEKTLRENGVFCNAYQYMDLPVVAVEIHWGDWKHDHWRADWLAEEMGGTVLATNITEENGSDCYSAIHHYIFNADF